jgi:hypothetical protein
MVFVTEQQIESLRTHPLVPSTATDRYFDYCLQPYEPRRSPHGKLRGETLLWHSFAVAKVHPVLYQSVLALQQDTGRDATVFGIKHIDGQFRWELYFYDPQKQDPRVRATALAQTLQPYLQLRPQVRESIPYFMVSFDLYPQMQPNDIIDAVNLYLAEPVGQAGRSYKVTETFTELENYYFFFHPKTAIKEVLYRIKSSAIVDFEKYNLAQVLLPELFSCRRICVAKKRRADAVYYSGIDVDQLIWFLKRFLYPTALIDFIGNHREKLDHLRFDVGLDYFIDANGSLVVPKTSYYSTV